MSEYGLFLSGEENEKPESTRRSESPPKVNHFQRVTSCPCLSSLVYVRFRVRQQLSCLQNDRQSDHITSANKAEVTRRSDMSNLQLHTAVYRNALQPFLNSSAVSTIKISLQYLRRYKSRDVTKHTQVCTAHCTRNNTRHYAVVVTTTSEMLHHSAP